MVRALPTRSGNSERRAVQSTAQVVPITSAPTARCHTARRSVRMIRAIRRETTRLTAWEKMIILLRPNRSMRGPETKPISSSGAMR